MTPLTRKLIAGAAALVCAYNAAGAATASKALDNPAAREKAAALTDPMSAVNPYNSGADPVTMPGDARMVVFTYSRDQIYRVVTAPMKLTTIELAPGEQLVTEPAMGDSVQWIIDTDGANHVFIKPTKPGLVNTLHLSTNQREYDMTLVSSPLGGLFYQSVRFRYTQPLMDKVRARQDAGGGADLGVGGIGGIGGALAGNGSGGRHSCPIAVSPDKLNFEYSISGSAPFRPEAVFDDGKAMWFRLPTDAPFAVPVIKDHGDEISPNFITCEQYIVVQQLADEVTLNAPHYTVTVKRRRPGLFGF